jgi:hypothetical protein
MQWRIQNLLSCACLIDTSKVHIVKQKQNMHSTVNNILLNWESDKDINQMGG